MKNSIILLLVLTLSIVFASCKTLPQENSSATESTTSTFSSIYSELESMESSATDTHLDAQSSFSVQDESTTSNATSTVSKDETFVSTPNTSSDTSSSDAPKVVQLADPETGISWDGVSPIIYTYPDGTTGTEKRDGATYEGIPGMWTTINLAAENYVSEYDGTCKRCGKKGWDGTNGTCGSWLEDIDCPNCGEHVEAYTCHTCDE